MSQAGKCGKRVLLIGHMDTVFEKDGHGSFDMVRTLLTTIVLLISSFAAAQERTTRIYADTAFDGRGRVLRNVSIEVRGDKIVSIRESVANDRGSANYDLHGLTVLPGWIDSHTHLTRHFGPNGHFGEKDESPERATLEAEGNAWHTLLAGFTTIQSLGSPEDVPLRDEINRGVVPGPRILTAIHPLGDEKLTPPVRPSTRAGCSTWCWRGRASAV